MTNDERRTYSNQSISQYKQLERGYLRKIYLALRSQITAFVNTMQSEGLRQAQNDLYITVLNDQIAPIIRQLYIDSGIFFRRKTEREIKNSTREKIKAGFGINQQLINDIIAYFSTELFQTVSSITQSTREQILSVLSKGMNEGWGIDQIAKELQSSDLLLWRARLIARTELAKGAFVGRKLATQDSEWETEKEWIAANDHRTRHSHRITDGARVDFDKKFIVQRPKGGVDLMDGPGDPSASIENIANCRCSLSVIAKRNAAGRLIRKQPGISIPSFTPQIIKT